MLLIGNGTIITHDNNNPFINDGCICVKDNVIHDLGTTEIMRKRYQKAKYINAKRGLIMPGLINPHHHIYSSFARGLSINNYSPTNFTDILKGMWWKLDNLLTLEDIRYSAYITYIDCIKNGVTTVFDHHASYGAIRESLSQISNVADEIGIRTCLCYEVSDRHGENKMLEAVNENIEYIDYVKHRDNDMQKAMMGLHASFTLSNKTLYYINENLPTDTGYHIHVAEDISDLYDSREKYHKTVVKRLLDMNILGSKTLAIHCVHINPNEMDILKETDTMVIHNPESNMGNAVGCTKALEMTKRDITIGIGTDGYTSDMLESMKVANILHKHQNYNPSVAYNEVLQMLFDNNSIIANRFYNKPIGILQKGAYADIIIADYKPYTPMNQHNYNSHILFGLSGYNIKTTIINGKIIMQDNELIGIDERKIIAESYKLASKLWYRINN